MDNASIWSKTKLSPSVTLRPDDEVVLEATGNTAAIKRLLRPFVGQVVTANPCMVRAIAYTHVKTDKIDAATPRKPPDHDLGPPSKLHYHDGRDHGGDRNDWR
jgi:hypothetical protein